MDLRKLIADYLREAKLIQLATLDGLGNPWVCSVWFVADDNLNIYWISSTTREHSKHIKNNKVVAAAMAVPQTPQDQARGLQLSGTAEELTSESDIAEAKRVYGGHIFDEQVVEGFVANKAKPHHFYRIKPKKFVLFDAVNYPEESRQEYIVPAT